MSTTTVTSQDQREIFDHEFDAPSMTPAAPRISVDEHDRMLEQLVAESREQRMREHRREAEATRIHRRRVRGAVATGTVAIVIAVGGTLFFLEGPSSGTSPQSASSGQSAPAASIAPASAGSQAVPVTPITPSSGTTTVPASNVTPATPAPGPSGNNTGNMGTGPGPSGNSQIPSGNNTGNMGSNGGPLNGGVSQ